MGGEEWNVSLFTYDGRITKSIRQKQKAGQSGRNITVLICIEAMTPYDSGTRCQLVGASPFQTSARYELSCDPLMPYILSIPITYLVRS